LKGSLSERHPNWIELVEEAQSLLYRGREVYQMMLVIGEEGVSIDDLIVYLKAEAVDAVCLQQDSFDAVERATSKERQIADFLLLMDMVRHPFSFDSKEQAKKEMTHIQNLFFQMKYAPFRQEYYLTYRKEIESILGKGVNPE
jgi:V/A-type H+-transporting ATPase subunit A